ncbi:TOBE domain-containing protein, partial [Cupriavidus sp. 2MCAB6]
ILLRPEQLRLRPSAASELAGGTGGRIVEVEFGGASSLVTIALDADTDTLLQLRSSDLSPPEPGTHVAIEVSGAAYPFDGATALEPAGKAKR